MIFNIYWSIIFISQLNNTTGKELIKLNYYNLIINKFIYKFMPNQIFYFLKSLVKKDTFKNK